MTHNSSGLTHDYDALFLLDFAGRYAVDRCGSDDTIDVAIMSVFCVVPVYIWISMQVLTFIRPDVYLLANGFTITLLTITQTAMLFLFSKTPPVAGCGPSRSYPSAQAALCGYVMVSFVCYSRDFRKQTLFTMSALTVFVWMVFFSVLTIGFGSAPSVLSGTILGCTTACTLHESLVHITDTQPRLLERAARFVSWATGRQVLTGMLTARDVKKRRADTPQKNDAAVVVMGFPVPEGETGVQLG
jgi:hypothetical protein